jgi:hypothetical protein
VAVVTRREDVAAPVGSYGWDGGLGTSWRSRVSRDFWTAAYQAIDD